MRTIVAFTAALSSTLCVGNASALFVMMDDFGLPAPAETLADDVGGGATSSVAQIVTPSGFSRTFSHELTLGDFRRGNFASIGSTTFPAGALEVANTSGHDAEVRIMWNISAEYLAAYPAAQFGVYLYETDGNPVSMSMSIGATSLGKVNLPTRFPAFPAANPVLFPTFDAAQMAAINAGGALTMTLNGAEGWDLSLDAAGFQVPEPTSLALVGLALISAGATSRR